MPNATRRQAERWIALEFLVVVVARTIAGFQQQKGLLGAQNYAAMAAAFALLSIFTLSDTTAEIGSALGLLVVLAVLLRQTPGVKPGTTSVLGSDVADAFAGFATKVGAAQPTISKGYTPPAASS